MKNPPANAGDPGDAGSIPESGRSLGRRMATYSNTFACIQISPSCSKALALPQPLWDSSVNLRSPQSCVPQAASPRGPAFGTRAHMHSQREDKNATFPKSHPFTGAWDVCDITQFAQRAQFGWLPCLYFHWKFWLSDCSFKRITITPKLTSSWIQPTGKCPQGSTY